MATAAVMVVAAATAAMPTMEMRCVCADGCSCRCSHQQTGTLICQYATSLCTSGPLGKHGVAFSCSWLARAGVASDKLSPSAARYSTVHVSRDYDGYYDIGVTYSDSSCAILIFFVDIGAKCLRSAHAFFVFFPSNADIYVQLAYGCGNSL
jgi:hypothetical protein